jgi:hypothetical protein
MGLELHVARFFKNSKMAFKSFKKSGSKNLDIDNDEIYQCAKKNPKIVAFLAQEK